MAAVVEKTQQQVSRMRAAFFPEEPQTDPEKALLSAYRTYLGDSKLGDVTSLEQAYTLPSPLEDIEKAIDLLLKQPAHYNEKVHAILQEYFKLYLAEGTQKNIEKFKLNWVNQSINYEEVVSFGEGRVEQNLPKLKARLAQIHTILWPDEPALNFQASIAKGPG